MAKPRGSIYVADIKRHYKEKVYTTVLLRCTYREDGKVKQQTLANLTHLPPEVIAAIRLSLNGTTLLPRDEAIEITRTRSHGHVAAVRSMLRHLGLHEMISPQPSRERDLVEAMIVARVVDAQTKLATTRWWQGTTLPDDLGVADANEDELYAAMDWLLARQASIERHLAAAHLTDGCLVLYDVSSSYYEGSHCPLAAFGHNRDKKQGKRQIVYGLIADACGRPIAVEVFPGNTGDPTTVNSQVRKLKDRYKLKHVVFAGDRGMLTSARIAALKEEGGVDWVSALRAPAIKKLAHEGYIQPSLFDQHDLVEIASPDFPGERLVVCRNPYLAEERARKRRELLAATEQLLDGIARRVAAGKLKRADKIGIAVGRCLGRHKMGKHFECEIATGRFSYKRREEAIRQEAELDGLYVVRTSVPATAWCAEDVVIGYKSLSHAERAFRTLKSIDIKVRPIHHRVPERVRAHILLCMLAYYVEWHLRQAWKPLLFDDEEPGQRLGPSPVTPAVRSESALQKAALRQHPDGTPIHSFATLLADLGTIARNDARAPACPELPPFTLVTTPTAPQREALERVGVTIKEHYHERRQQRPA